ncbi:hypothetical protein V502_05100 [Pseudogymnoascus sp. VKM F-4520 (FW-2644)]|nr:hypothetical protein V502_05100 [Pseudogymnoascus sp. VKM F-4520 (FW-2644)]
MAPSRFVVLRETISGDEISNIMGRVVADTTDPLRRFVPDENSNFNAQDIVKDLSLTPTVYRDRNDIIKLASDATLVTRLSSYFSLQASHSSDRAVEVRSDEVKRYRMSNHSLKFETLMRDKRYRQQVEALLNDREVKRKEAYLIVAFLTSKMSRWNVASRKAHGLSSKLRVPVGEAVGDLSGAIDPELEAIKNKSEESLMQGFVMQEEVFAVAYDTIRLKGWKRQTIEHKGEARGRGTHLGFGEEGEGSDAEIEEEPEGEDEESLEEKGEDMSGDDEKLILCWN